MDNVNILTNNILKMLMYGLTIPYNKNCYTKCYTKFIVYESYVNKDKSYLLSN